MPQQQEITMIYGKTELQRNVERKEDNRLRRTNRQQDVRAKKELEASSLKKSDSNTIVSEPQYRYATPINNSNLARQRPDLTIGIPMTFPDCETVQLKFRHRNRRSVARLKANPKFEENVLDPIGSYKQSSRPWPGPTIHVNSRLIQLLKRSNRHQQRPQKACRVKPRHVW